jgi:hypothetical protein
MLRLFIVAVLVIPSTSAFAQSMEEVKGIKYGIGCTGPVTTFSAQLGACTIEGSKSRIWCPSGKIFDRNIGEIPQPFVVRSICNLNQVL